MPNVIPAPIPPATATASGVVSTGAQVLGAGVKTFSSGIVANSASVGSPGVSINAGAFNNHSPINVTNIGANAGLNLSFAAGVGGGALNLGDASGLGKALTASNATLNLFSTSSGTGRVRILGEDVTSGTGVSVVAGTLTADGSVHASADLFRVSTGLGGTEVRRFYVNKVGMGGGRFYGGSAGNYLDIQDGAGVSLVWYSAGLAVDNSGMRAYAANGGTTGDLVYKIGTSLADASVNAGAKLFTIRTGVGGTEVEKLSVNKAGDINTGGSLTFSRTLQDTGVSGFSTQIITPTKGGQSDTSGGVADANPLWKFRNFGANKAIVTGSGRFDQAGTDSSGTPGAATINKPSGISAIASGTNTVTITNSLATASSRIMIEWYGDHGAARHWINRSAGAFTVVLPTNATGNTAFGWEISELL